VKLRLMMRGAAKVFIDHKYFPRRLQPRIA
jgi:hypothetical protein